MTGEHSPKGRKGGWWIPASILDSRTRNLLENKYKFKKHKDADTGEVFFFTIGKKGTEAFGKAWETCEPMVEARAKEIFGELNAK